MFRFWGEGVGVFQVDSQPSRAKQVVLIPSTLFNMHAFLPIGHL